MPRTKQHDQAISCDGISAPFCNPADGLYWLASIWLNTLRKALKNWLAPILISFRVAIIITVWSVGSTTNRGFRATARVAPTIRRIGLRSRSIVGVGLAPA